MKRPEGASFICLLVIALFTFSCDDQRVDPATDSSSALVESSTAAATAFSNLIYFENMEGALPFSTAHDLDVGTWDYALQFVADTVYQGLKSARFEIHEDQPLVATGKRSEVTIVKGSAGEVGKNAWYSFAVLFPTVGYEYDNERELINQWYQNGSPATSLRTRRDRMLLESGNTPDTRRQFDLGPIIKDQWHEFVMHFIHSFGDDGLIEIWIDGVKKLTLTGGNMYDDVLPKWKIGLYKSAFKYGTSDVSRRIIYFDNVKVGNESSTYETMRPGL